MQLVTLYIFDYYNVTVQYNTIFSCLKRLNVKEPILVVFLSSVRSEFQSLVPAIWKVFLPEEVSILKYICERG